MYVCVYIYPHAGTRHSLGVEARGLLVGGFMRQGLSLLPNFTDLARMAASIPQGSGMLFPGSRSQGQVGPGLKPRPCAYVASRFPMESSPSHMSEHRPALATPSVLPPILVFAYR